MQEENEKSEGVRKPKAVMMVGILFIPWAYVMCVCVCSTDCRKGSEAGKGKGKG